MGSEDVEVGQELDAQSEVERSEQSETRAEEAPKSTGPQKKNNSEKDQPQPSGMEALKPGTRVKGKVRNVVDFGAFIDIGVGRDGLSHISTLKRAGIDSTIKPGDVLNVVVRRINVEENRISLSIPAAESEEQNKTSLRDLQVNSVVTGHVARLVDFGAFIDIGARSAGLLHISHLPFAL